MDTKKLLEVLDKHIDQAGLTKDLLKELFIPYLRKFVSSTENRYDDALIEAIIGYMEKN